MRQRTDPFAPTTIAVPLRAPPAGPTLEDMATREQEILEVRDLAGLTNEQLVRFYAVMVTSRRIDDREINLKRQNNTFFQIASAGHEAVGVTVAEHCRAGPPTPRRTTIRGGRCMLSTNCRQRRTATDTPSTSSPTMARH